MSFHEMWNTEGAPARITVVEETDDGADPRRTSAAARQSIVPALDLRDLEPADTARSVGSDDDFASHFLLDPVGIGEEDARPLAGHVDDSRITDPEPDVAPVPISSRG